MIEEKFYEILIITILSSLIPSALMRLWKFIIYPTRLIMFFPLDWYKNSKFVLKTFKIEFIEMTPFRDYIRRWKKYFLTGDYEFSEKEKRHKWFE